jgi:hypothetical protein
LWGAKADREKEVAADPDMEAASGYVCWVRLL